MTIIVRPATPEDLPTVASILHEAASWLTERGDPLWHESELDAAELRRDVASGLYYLAEVDGEPAGTVRFEFTDPLFWPDVEEGQSAFIHRFAVRRRFAGGRTSTAVLRWAADRARALGLTYLRLDCDAERPRLRQIYERFGFRHHSDRQVGPFFAARYELPLNGSAVSPKKDQPSPRAPGDVSRTS